MTTDTAYQTYRPPNALTIWTDGRSIYVELPTTSGGPPCIISYRYSEGGLSKALDLLGKHADIAGAPLLVAPPKRHPKSSPGTETQHAMAEQILRKTGILR